MLTGGRPGRGREECAPRSGERAQRSRAVMFQYGCHAGWSVSDGLHRCAADWPSAITGCARVASMRQTRVYGYATGTSVALGETALRLYAQGTSTAL